MLARELLRRRAMMQRGRSLAKTWVTLACLAIGGHAGFAAHDLFGRSHHDCVPTPAEPVVVVTPPPPQHDVAVSCPDAADCVVDLVALERERMPFPRGLRLEPRDGGLRLDGARGILVRLGLRNGDVLLALDEFPLRDGADLSVLNVGVKRGGFVLRYRREDLEYSKHITIVSDRA